MRLEKHVEDLIESDASCLGEPLLIIGRQNSITEFGSPDLLALDSTGGTRTIEVKRGEADRNTIAQVLEYTSWINTLSTDEILATFARHKPGVDLGEAYFACFGHPRPAVLNQSHAIIIVAAGVEPKTELNIRSLQRDGFPLTLVNYRYYEDLPAIQFAPRLHRDLDGESGTGSEKPASTRPVSAGELARWHSSLDDLGASLEELRPTLEALRRPSSAATTYGPVGSMRGIDQYILLFWLTYAWRFAWDFVPFRFLYPLYRHWLRTQAAAGLILPVLEAPAFGRRLAAAATATGEWTYTRRSPEDLMDAPEPLTALVPDWKRPGAHQSVHGYLRNGIDGRLGESPYK